VEAAKSLLPEIRPGTRYVRSVIVVTDLREGPAWQMKRNIISPRYTTRWDELLTVKAASNCSMTQPGSVLIYSKRDSCTLGARL